MKKYLRAGLNAVQKHLVYRARIVNWAIVDISHVIIFPFLWLSLYQGNTVVGGLTREDIVTYYIVTIFIGMCANSHISRYIQEDIVKGTLNERLVKPMSYFFYRTTLENGYRILIIPIFFALLFLSSFFVADLIRFPASVGTLGIFFFFIFCTHIIFSCLEFLIGLSAFFFQEIQGFTFLRSILEKLLGGAFAPLVLLPVAVQKIAHVLPFQYLYFIPTQIYLGKITGVDIWKHAGITLFWVIFLCSCVALMWKKGLRRYDGGGI